MALGKKLGTKMKEVSSAFVSLSQEDILKFEKEGQYSLSIDGNRNFALSDVEITSEDIPGGLWPIKDIDSCFRYYCNS